VDKIYTGFAQPVPADQIGSSINRLIYVLIKCFFFFSAVKWIKFNDDELTIGSKGDQFGSFNITVPGQLITIKLVWKSGYLTDQINYPATRGHWWGNDRSGNPNDKLGIIITG